MKMNITYIVRVSVSSFVIAFSASVLASQGEEIAEFFRVLDSSCQKHQPADLVRLAASTTGKGWWSMAAGEGPNDAASLRLRALKARPQWLFDERGLLREEIAFALGNNVSPAGQHLIDRLKIDPSHTADMLNLLSDHDPSVRWIGIYKARFLPTAPPEILQALRGIAANDDFVMLVDTPMTGTGPTPAPLHALASREFIAPLRTLANEQLAKWNEQGSENPHDVARTGLKRLLKDYDGKPDARRDILWALSRLHVELSPIAKTELDRLTPEHPDQQQTVSAFKNAATSQ